MAETKRNPHDVQAHAIGTLVSCSLETTKPKDETKKATTYWKGEIGANGSKIRVTVFGSKKKPDLPQELSQQLGQGMKVSARGSLEEQVSEDGRLFRGMRAWGVGQADAHEEPRLVYHISGHMGRLEKTAAGEHVVPITSVRQYEKDGAKVDQESTLRVCPPEQMLAKLYGSVPVGKVIRARGDIIAKTEMDRFGLPSGEFVNRLEVTLIDVWDEQKELWSRLDEVTLMTQPGATVTLPVTSNPRPTANVANDDDDVPF